MKLTRNMATEPNVTDFNFEEIFAFLSQYHWIHDLHVTKFLESKVWEHFPIEWSRVFSLMMVPELNSLPFHNTSSTSLQELCCSTPLPDSLVTFLQKSSSFSHIRQQARERLPEPTLVSKELCKGMSPKKQHEVEWMASLVHQVASQADCSVVVDVGSGLGYLGQTLHKNYGLSVIGLESSAGHSEGAERRAAEQGLRCSGMRSIPFLITQDEDNIQQFCEIIRKIATSIQPCQHSPAGDLHDKLSSCVIHDTETTIQSYQPQSSTHQLHSQQHSAESSSVQGIEGCGYLPENEKNRWEGQNLSERSVSRSCYHSVNSDLERDDAVPTEADDCDHCEKRAMDYLDCSNEGGSADGHCDPSQTHQGSACETDHINMGSSCGGWSSSEGLLPCQARTKNFMCSYQAKSTHTTISDEQETKLSNKFSPGEVKCTCHSARLGAATEHNLSSEETSLEDRSDVKKQDKLSSDETDCSVRSKAKKCRGCSVRSETQMCRDCSVRSEDRMCGDCSVRSEDRMCGDCSVRSEDRMFRDCSVRSETQMCRDCSVRSEDRMCRDCSVRSETQMCGDSSVRSEDRMCRDQPGLDEAGCSVTSEMERGGNSLRVCLIGLHCCGDLTPAMLQLYQRVDFLRALCCVSCCYHKMQPGQDSGQFSNFPMSAAANAAYAAVCSQRKPPLSSSSSSSSSIPSAEAAAPVSQAFLTPCSLRLAAQETRTRWAAQSEGDHDRHIRHVGYRAILELFFRETAYSSQDRKSMRRLDYSTFDRFVESYVTSAGIVDAREKQATQDRLNTLYENLKPYFTHIEPYTCLQVMLQPVLESAVLWDRQQWLMEQGLSSEVVPIFDEHVSPRNLALVSCKR